MKIVISEHAKRRAEERGIDEETIRSVLEEPLDVIKVKFGRKAAYGQFGEKVNAMYVRFKEGKVAESESLADNVIVDIDEKGEVVEGESMLGIVKVWGKIEKFKYFKVQISNRKEVLEMEIRIGNLDLFEDGWFEALKCIAVKKISEATGEPAKLATGTGCNDDEALHVMTASGKVFHVCYSDPVNVFAIEEVRCPHCGQWVPVDMIEEHAELCVGDF